MFFCKKYEYPEIVDEKINTVKFLEASKGIVKFVELLGTVFTPVKNDINGNIEKLYKIQKEDETTFSTLQGIVEYELEQEDKIGTDALLWLKRALEYVQVFLTCFVNDYHEGKCTESLSPFFHKAYDEKLKPYHGWIVQKLFGLIVMAAPSRTTLIQTLSCGGESLAEEEVYKDLEQFTKGLNSNLIVINDIYNKYDLDSKAVV